MSLMAIHVPVLDHLLRAAPVRILAHLTCVFLARHWLLGVANAGLTALLGLSALRLMARLAPARTMSVWRLTLRQIVLVAALAKGAFYLILGDGHHMRVPDAFGFGFQCPSLSNILPLAGHLPFTIWRPTEATDQVGLLLAAFATLMLAWRSHQFVMLLRWLRSLDHAAAAGDAASASRARAALRRAADALSLPTGTHLPTVVLTELPEATLVLLGLWQPYILLPPSLLGTLTDYQLEMALRHELAHLRRRDHWHRWILLWVGDLGSLNPLTRWCSREVMALDEQFCDRRCVASARDAVALAQALRACRHSPAIPPQPGDPPPLPRYVFPRMAGELLRPGADDETLRMRLRYLLSLAVATHKPTTPGNQNKPVSSSDPRLRAVMTLACEGLLAVLLVVIVYVKFYCIINVS